MQSEAVRDDFRRSFDRVSHLTRPLRAVRSWPNYLPKPKPLPALLAALWSPNGFKSCTQLLGIVLFCVDACSLLRRASRRFEHCTCFDAELRNFCWLAGTCWAPSIKACRASLHCCKTSPPNASSCHDFLQSEAAVTPIHVLCQKTTQVWVA